MNACLFMIPKKCLKLRTLLSMHLPDADWDNVYADWEFKREWELVKGKESWRKAS